MKYHQFTPEPDAVAARILTQEPASTVQSVPPAGAAPGARAESRASLPSTLEGITALRDRAFVEAAYRVLLGREPDEPALAHSIHQLRSGALDKVDILGDLRHSPEGQARAVDIAGLDWRYRLRRLGRRRGIGWFVRWWLAALRLPALVRVAQRHQAEIEQASVVADEHAAAIQALGRALRELRTLASRMNTAESALGELFGAGRTVSLRVDAAETGMAGLMAELAATQQTFEMRHQHLSAANARLIQQLQDMRGTVAPVPLPQSPPAGAAPDRALPDPDEDNWYLAFEDIFRGSREDTKRSQEIYLDYVEAAGAGTAAAAIIDIGCGRGEWLELLQQHGCIARGVDLNHAMVLDNRARGLDVVERDVLAYLADVPDASVGMVTGFHIIEHLRFDLLIRLFDECRRVLRPGGCMLFETPNPENLVVGAYTFYFDPTHRHPLPPKMIEFAVRERGFADVEILRLHPRSEEGTDHALLDKWFRGPTDYAVIAWKDGRAAR